MHPIHPLQIKIIHPPPEHGTTSWTCNQSPMKSLRHPRLTYRHSLTYNPPGIASQSDSFLCSKRSFSTHNGHLIAGGTYMSVPHERGWMTSNSIEWLVLMSRAQFLGEELHFQNLIIHIVNVSALPATMNSHLGSLVKMGIHAEQTGLRSSVCLTRTTPLAPRMYSNHMLHSNTHTIVSLYVHMQQRCHSIRTCMYMYTTLLGY